MTLADKNPYVDFVVNTHPLYSRYQKEWNVQQVSWWGGTEYKRARLLRAYAVDLQTPNETINTYVTAPDGSIISKNKV